MYMMLCWQIPKLFSAVLGGSPALAGETSLPPVRL
jgi:hypothetical protein